MPRLYKRTGQEKPCLVCRKVFYSRPSRRQKYCCHACSERDRKPHSPETIKKMSQIAIKNGNDPPSKFKPGHKFYLKKHSIETRRKLREIRIGENNPRWGWRKPNKVTPLNDQIRKSWEYKKWRISVYERDDYTCQSCGIRGGKLHAHHIKSFSQYPSLRFELSNGQTLCVSCHRKTNNYGSLACA